MHWLKGYVEIISPGYHMPAFEKRMVILSEMLLGILYGIPSELLRCYVTFRLAYYTYSASTIFLVIIHLEFITMNVITYEPKVKMKLCAV